MFIPHPETDSFCFFCVYPWKLTWSLFFEPSSRVESAGAGHLPCLYLAVGVSICPFLALSIFLSFMSLWFLERVREGGKLDSIYFLPLSIFILLIIKGTRNQPWSKNFIRDTGWATYNRYVLTTSFSFWGCGSLCIKTNINRYAT